MEALVPYFYLPWEFNQLNLISSMLLKVRKSNLHSLFASLCKIFQRISARNSNKDTDWHFRYNAHFHNMNYTINKLGNTIVLQCLIGYYYFERELEKHFKVNLKLGSRKQNPHGFLKVIRHHCLLRCEDKLKDFLFTFQVK